MNCPSCGRYSADSKIRCRLPPRGKAQWVKAFHCEHCRELFLGFTRKDLIGLLSFVRGVLRKGKK